MINDLLKIIDDIQNEGNVVLIKFDGEREQNKITVAISHPEATNKPVIRHDGDNLEKLLQIAIDQYYESK